MPKVDEAAREHELPLLREALEEPAAPHSRPHHKRTPRTTSHPSAEHAVLHFIRTLNSHLTAGTAVAPASLGTDGRS